VPSAVIPHGTKVHYAAGSQAIVLILLDPSHLGKWAIAQLRMTPVEKSDAEIVCLVDDDLSVLKSIERLLASDGLSVRGFNKPKEFLLHVQAHSVPVVILDIWMEEMSGLEVQAQLSALSPQTRVIVITGRDDPAAKLNARQMGVVAFFRKPFDDDQFLKAVHGALAIHPVE
jgi:FixJ family two-component response regulator